MAWVDFIPHHLTDGSGLYVDAWSREYYSDIVRSGYTDSPSSGVVVSGPCQPLVQQLKAGDFMGSQYPWPAVEAENYTTLLWQVDSEGTVKSFYGVVTDDIPESTRFRVRASLLSSEGPYNIRVGFSDFGSEVWHGEVEVPAGSYGAFGDWVEIDYTPEDYTYFGVGTLRQACVQGLGPLKVEWQIWVDEPPPPGFKVYELDKGWSFDGNYIPHFLEMNWYFGDDPFTDKTIQKVRVHGLAKGLAQLQLSVAGMQHDYDSDYTEPQYIDLPRNAAIISTDYLPTTNYVDSSNWGVSMQLKFEGRNTDLSRPEPSHVLQVLALQGSPQDNGRRIN